MNILKAALSTVLFISFITSVKTASAQRLTDSSIGSNNTTPLNNATETLKRLTPVSFNNNGSGLQYGFQLDEVKAAIPEIVKAEHKLVPAGKNNFKNQSVDKVDMVSLIPFLVSSLKEQQEEIERLKTEIKSLKKQADKK